MHTTMTLPQESDGPDAGDEGALVEEARRDPAAFAALYRLYRDRIYWYVRSHTRIEEDAADLTQQIFVQALGALDQYRPRRGPFAAWLFGIARHALANMHRRRATVTWEMLPGALQPVAADDPTVALQRREDIERLRGLFLALDADKRDLLALRFVARLTVGEIAAVIGKSEAATHKRLARTLRALAIHFEEHNHDEQR
jgi:RNA polymerase sigma-70 factor (ECF subfamily)